MSETTLNTINWDFIKNEDSPRIPDRDDLCLAYEQGLNFMQVEYMRSRNLDESKVPPYTLPALPDTLADWEKERPEIWRKFQECMYGDCPPPPDSMEFKLLAERDDALDGIALRREYRVYCNMNNGRSFNFDMLVYLPKNCTEPPPCFVHLNMKGNHAYGPDMDIRQSRAAMPKAGRWHAVYPNEQPRGQDVGRMSYAEGVRRGYAMATACHGEIFPDNLDGFRKSCFTLFYDDLRPDCEVSLAELQAGYRRNIGAYAAWAWGYCRVADALEKLGLADPNRMACVGQSRLAVASLLAGVQDERFKLVCCNNSGSGGAQLNRRNFGSMLQVFRSCRPNWVCSNLEQYIGREDTMPVDQHQLLALIAPRMLYVATSSEDLNGDPHGSFLSAKHASKVWNLYGLKGLENENMPPADTPIGNDMVRYHVKTGKHSLTTYDWAQYFRTADELFGMDNNKQC